MTGQRPLWVCPRCQRGFVTANVWHSCYVGTVDDFFANHKHLQPLFEELVALIRGIGTFDIEVVKTRISFTTRARFAGVARLRRDGLVVGFWLKRHLVSDRFLRVENLGSHDWVYQVVVRSPADLDDELLAWLAEAYTVGRQESGVSS
ncbi:MAG: DUF5655 domain-containing protein [Acidimicrobiia bacterium]|nr:DUF5655 domain-containing protein [Acidimicrobiia bacterium]